LFHVPHPREWNSGTKSHFWNKEWNINGTKFFKLFIYKGLKVKQVEQGWNKNGTRGAKVVPGLNLLWNKNPFLKQGAKHA
jgi:hypothetical protein